MSRAVAAAALLALGLAACSGSESGGRFPLREPFASPTSSNSLVVGLVGTMSGPDSWRGEDAYEGADFGVHVLNRNRARGTRPFELVALDDEGRAARATELVRQLASLGSTVGIVYAGPPQGLPPAEGALARAGLPAVACYGDLRDAALRRGHLFQASPGFSAEAHRLVSYLAGDRGYGTLGALVQASPTGAAARRALRSAMGRSRARLALVARYGVRDRSLQPQLRRLRARHVEAVVLQGSPPAAARVLEALAAMGARYTTTPAARRGGRRAPPPPGTPDGWRPQVAGFDDVLGPTLKDAPAGTVAADSYARGASYLPVPSLSRFRAGFRDWWDSLPNGWEQRSFEAARMIGWAAGRAGQEDDLASVLEGLSGRRFGGLPVSLSRSDHSAVDPATVGIWVVPRQGIRVTERGRPALFSSWPWVPLARGFGRDGLVTRILPADRPFLFEGPQGAGGPAPPISRMIFGVTTSRADLVH